MHTHMSLFKDGRNQFFDAKRPASPLEDGEGVHRRAAACTRARSSAVLRAVGQLVQAARPGLRGAGLRRVVAAQPLGADPDPALQAGGGAGDPRGDPLPRPGLQPLPRVRGAAPCRSRGDRARLRAAGRDDDEPLPALRRGAGGAGRRGAARLARGGRRGAGGLGAHVPCPRRRTSSRATSSSSGAKWDEYRIQVSEWEKRRYLSSL